MEMLNFRKSCVYAVDGSVIESAEVSTRCEKVSYNGCDGYAYYVSVKSERGMSGEETAALFPEISDTDRYLAIDNHSSYWCRPAWGKSLCELPQKVQELILDEGGCCRVFMPVTGKTSKTLIRGGDDGMRIYLTTNLDGLCEIEEQLSFIYMEGKKPSELLYAVAHVAAKKLGNRMQLREERGCPEVFDYLGWCSWDAFKIRVSHEKLLEKAAEFKEKGVPVKYAIIDDMWGDCEGLNEAPDDWPTMISIMHKSRMRSFEGDPMRFPEGMKGAIRDLKAAGIDKVGVWFPTTGYWLGLAENGKLARELEDCIAMSTAGRLTVKPEDAEAEKYFDVISGKVKSWDADFVKIDNQGFHHNFKNQYTYGESARAVQTAINKAVYKYFDGDIINCMGMPSECLFNRTESAVCRCSDDFQPESLAWFAKNILQNAYNGLMQGQFHVNDWDMWWTDDAQAERNGLCRAISGGPVYVSDTLGRTRAEVLKPLCLGDGRILRPDRSGAPSEDCLFSDPTKEEKLFKIQNVFGDNGVCAVFNINAENKPCSGTVSAEDCNLSSGKYAYYEYFSRSGGVLGAGEKISLELKSNTELALYTFVPIKDGKAVMGRTDLYMGVGAVSREGNELTLKEAGEIAIIDESGRLEFIDVQGNELTI